MDKIKLKEFNLKDLLPNATILILGKRRSGKCFEKGTKIMKYTGEAINVEDIKENDILLGDDNKPRIVSNIYSDTGELYKIKHSNGVEYTVNKEHILCLKYKKENIIKENNVSWFDMNTLKYKSKKFKTKELADDFFKNIPLIKIQLKTFLELPKEIQKDLRGYQKTVEYGYESKACVEKELPINPYIVGYWLYSKEIPELNELCKEILNSTDFIEIQSNVKRSKWIPDIYRYNCRENRIKLFNGILDASKKYKKVQLSDELLNEILLLGYSLGYYCEKSGKKFKLKKKAEYLKSVLDIKSVGNGDYYGFEVDCNNRFMLSNCVVTHNSFLIRDIFYNHKNIPRGIVLSGTESANPFFGDFFPDTFIYSEYDTELIESAMLQNSKKVKQGRKISPETDGLLPSNRFCIVLDDMAATSKQWKNEDSMSTIFMNGRHYNIFFIITLQYINLMPPALRANVDYLFIFNEPSIKNRRVIYENFGSVVPDFNSFSVIMDNCTENFECLVIKCTGGGSSNITDNIFWYKAKYHDNFKFGSEQMWNYHLHKYNKKYGDQEDKDKEEYDKQRKKYGKNRKLKVIINKEGDIVDYSSK